jgi:hypothetical protein
MEQKERPSFETLKMLAGPLVDILYKYYDPHSVIVITQTSVEILTGDMATPIEPRD